MRFRCSRAAFNRWLIGGLMAAALPAAACSSREGAGTIDVGDPSVIRAKAEGGAPRKPNSPNQAKALEDEEAAGKKHPKLK